MFVFTREVSTTSLVFSCKWNKKGSGIMARKTDDEEEILTPIEAKTALHKILYSAYCVLYNKYSQLNNYEKIYCPKCGKFLDTNKFYPSKKYISGVQPFCISCSTLLVEQKSNKNEQPHETKESVRRMMAIYDLPYIDTLYEDCIHEAEKSNNYQPTPFHRMMTHLNNDVKYRNLTYKDSIFPKDNDTSMDLYPDSHELINMGKKRFGLGYSDEDYIMLETEYQDWISRYDCDTKTQEKIFERLSFNNLAFNKANKAGQSTKDLDKTYQELLSSLDILPKQASGNGINDALTFGQLIEKWEKEDPIPEPEEEFKDVDRIGKYIRVWFKGYLAKAMGIKNDYTKEFDDYVKEYKVSKPENDSDIYNEIFGNQED